MRIIAIRVSSQNGTIREVDVEAHVFGDWAVHLVPFAIRDSESDGWRVSHIPTGRSIESLADDLDLADAIAIAKALHARAPRDFWHDEREIEKSPVDGDARWIIPAIVGEALGEAA